MLGVKVGGVSAIEVEGSWGEACSAFLVFPPPKNKQSERFVKATGQGPEQRLSLIYFMLKKWWIKRLLYINKEDALLLLIPTQESKYKLYFITRREN